MSELLDPGFQSIETVFENELRGMTFVEVSLEELEATRSSLVKIIRENLTDAERNFILSIKKGEPQWELLGCEGIDLLPAVRWKLLNIAKMDKKKREAAIVKLEKSLGF